MSKRWVSPAWAGAAVAAVALAGVLLRIPAASPAPAPAPSPAPTLAPPTFADPSFADPVTSQAYTTVSPGPKATSTPGGPMPPTGTCPDAVEPMGLPVLNPWDATTWPRQVTAVTLCRYANSTFDTSQGHNTLVQGPVYGDLAVFTAALAKALPAVRPIDHRGCRIVSPGPPYTLDIVFVAAGGDGGRAYVMLRTVCDPPWLEDPELPLREAVDAALGPPY